MQPSSEYAFQQVETALAILEDDASPLRDRLADAWSSRLSRIEPARLPDGEARGRYEIVAALARGSALYAHKDVAEELLALRDALAVHLGLPTRRRQELAA